MTLDKALNNLKKGKCIPHKRETLTKIEEALFSIVKIRQEIVNLTESHLFGDVSNQTLHEVVLEIIDKHSFLSEVQDGND